MIVLTKQTRSNEEKHSELMKYLKVYLVTVNSLTGSTKSNKVLELANRTNNFLTALSTLPTDDPLLAYTQAQADDSGQYAGGYLIKPDLVAAYQAVTAMGVAIAALDLSAMATISTAPETTYLDIDTSSLLTAINAYKAVVS